MGCFVRGVKKWHGMFCPGMFCPAPVCTSVCVCRGRTELLFQINQIVNLPLTYNERGGGQCLIIDGERCYLWFVMFI